MTRPAARFNYQQLGPKAVNAPKAEGGVASICEFAKALTLNIPPRVMYEAKEGSCHMHTGRYSRGVTSLKHNERRSECQRCSLRLDYKPSCIRQ
jgi:hypothetical protein